MLQVMMISPNDQTPNRLCATPRAVEETTWVIGEVTLMESKKAMDMRERACDEGSDPKRGQRGREGKA